MPDLDLKGMLRLAGTLDLKTAGGGKVLVGGAQALVTLAPMSALKHATGVVVPLPPPAPVDTGLDVWVTTSFNATVTANGAKIVTQGLVAQGNQGTWPGMVLPSTVNPGVTVNGIAINVVGDMATILPTGAPATFSASGQP